MPADDSDLPLYARVRAQIEAIALRTGTADISEILQVPPEWELSRRLGVSRGTVRHALAELEREGLLIRQSGRGTYVNPMARLRRLVSTRLTTVAYPDSRFDMDFRRFAPDFAGAEPCRRHAAGLEEFNRARTIFLTPDNALQGLQAAALDQGKSVVVGTYEMRRGFYLLTPETVTPEDRRVAASLDGQERYGKRLTLPALRAIEKIDLVITGAIAVSSSGEYFGRGMGYFDLEWGLLSELRLVSDKTPAVAIVHDCQVVQNKPERREYDSVLDIIITPGSVLRPEKTRPKPSGLFWDRLSAEARHSPYIAEMLAARALGT